MKPQEAKFYKLVETKFDDLQVGDLVLKQGHVDCLYTITSPVVLTPDTGEMGNTQAEVSRIEDFLSEGL